MSLEINQYGIIGTIPVSQVIASGPIANGQRQRTQQDVVNAAVEGGRHSGEQWGCYSSRQCETNVSCRAAGVAARIERLERQRESWCTQHCAPERQFTDPSWLLSLGLQTLGPMAEGGAG